MGRAATSRCTSRTSAVNGSRSRKNQVSVTTTALDQLAPIRREIPQQLQVVLAAFPARGAPCAARMVRSMTDEPIDGRVQADGLGGAGSRSGSWARLRRFTKQQIAHALVRQQALLMDPLDDPVAVHHDRPQIRRAAEFSRRRPRTPRRRAASSPSPVPRSGPADAFARRHRDTSR